MSSPEQQPSGPPARPGGPPPGPEQTTPTAQERLDALRATNTEAEGDMPAKIDAAHEGYSGKPTPWEQIGEPESSAPESKTNSEPVITEPVVGDVLIQRDSGNRFVVDHINDTDRGTRIAVLNNLDKPGVTVSKGVSRLTEQLGEENPVWSREQPVVTESGSTLQPEGPGSPVVPEEVKSPLTQDAADAKRKQADTLGRLVDDAKTDAQAKEMVDNFESGTGRNIQERVDSLRHDLAQDSIDKSKEGKSPSTGVETDDLEQISTPDLARLKLTRDSLRKTAEIDPSLHNNPNFRQRMLDLDKQLSHVDAADDPENDDIPATAFAMGDSSYLVPKTARAEAPQSPVPPTEPPEQPPVPLTGPPEPPEEPPQGPIYGPPEPGPIYGPPAPPDQPPEEPPVPPEVPENRPEVPAFNPQELAGAIARLAKAKDRNDSIISRFHRKSKNESGLNDKGELQAATQNLEAVFARYTAGLAGQIVGQERPLDEEANQIRDRLSSGDLSQEETQTQAARLAQVLQEKNNLRAGAIGVITQEMLAARDRIDQAQLELKENKSGSRLGKWFRKNWTTRPGLRAGVSAGLLAAGMIGTATGFAPLALGAFALRRAVGTAATYAGVEGGGRKLTSVLSERKQRKLGDESIAALDATKPTGGGLSEAERAHALADAIANPARPEGAPALTESEQVSRERHTRFIEQHYHEIFDQENSLYALLGGAQVDPSKVVQGLVGDQLKQLEVDSNRTRRSKYVGAVAAIAVAGASALKFMDMQRPNPEDTDLNKALMRGIFKKHGPNASADWARLQNSSPDAVARLWKSSPTHGVMDQVFNNGEWRDKLRTVKDLEVRRNIAQLLGKDLDAGIASPDRLDSYIQFFNR